MRIALLLTSIGCGRIGFDPGATSFDDAPPDSPLGPWSAPVLVASDMEPLDDPSLTADELELYVNADQDVMVMRRSSKNDPWGALEPAPGLPTGYTQPFVSADGLTMYMTDFASNVEVSTRASRTDPWSIPVRADDLNAGLGADDAAPRADQLELALSIVGGGLALVRRAAVTDPWGAREPIAALAGASEACFGDGDLALYIGFRGVGGNPTDLYRSVRASLAQPFGAAEPIVELNTELEESDPWVSADGRTIYFTSTRGGNRAIWMSTR